MLSRGALSVAPAYRNTLEEDVSQQLAAAGVTFTFEAEKLPYEVPSRTAHYLQDFRVGRIVLEVKGRFGGPRARSSDDARERQKFVLLKEQYPELDIRFVFQRAATKIYKGSKTTYADWADAHGFAWCDKGRIPAEWIEDLKREMERCRSSQLVRPSSPRKTTMTRRSRARKA